MHQHPTGTVTLLFSDIEGSTHLLQQLGERYTELLALCRQVLRTAFQQYSGHEVDRQGDSFFVAFARATDAVLAAVEAQRTLAAQPWPEGVTVRVRMGIHTGEPQTGAEGYVGIDVHRAARIMSAGHGGQVLLSQTTCDLVEHDLPEGVSLRDMGAHSLKDLQHPNHLFQLVIEGLPVEFPALKTLGAHPNNLPIQLTSLIGREREVAAVQQLLQRQQVRLLTLTGPGGTGKTRLGLQAAAELSDGYTDGVYFVNLAPISDSELVIPTIAQTLGLKESATRPMMEALQAFLQEQQMLLLLDNFEQVVSAAPRLSELLSHCPHLKLLVTSRQVLHLSAEHEFPVPSLAIPDPQHVSDLEQLSQYEAVALFISRAQAVKPDFYVTNTNAPAVAEICVRLDGLPLGIELAAARIKLLSPQALLARLEHRLQVLTSGPQDAPTRQQTLRNTIAWSYGLLNAEEQRLFRRLSVFVGGCTFEAIEALCAALDGDDEAGHVLDSVASLLDKSLLHQRAREEEEPRFWMLPTLREYGLEVLGMSGEMERACQAHATYFVELAEHWEPQLRNVPQIAWLEQLEREHENLRATMQWSLHQGEDGSPLTMAWHLAEALLPFWSIHGHLSEGRTFLERVLTKREGASVNRQAHVLQAAGLYALQQGELDRAEMLAEESLRLYKQLEDRGGIADALALMGLLTWDRTNTIATRTLKEEVLALYREVNDKAGIAETLHELGWLARDQGEYDRGRALLEESLLLYKEIGDKGGIADTLNQMAHLLFDSQGDQAVIHSLLEESLSLFEEVGNKAGMAAHYHLAGRVAFNKGDMIAARSLLEKSLKLHKELGMQGGYAWSLSVLARVEASLKNYLTSRALHEESLLRAKHLKDRELITFCLEGFAAVVTSQGEPMQAARLWGTAETLRSAIGIPLPPVERAAYASFVTAARTQLGEHAFAAAWAAGRTMTPEQVLASEGREMNAPLISPVLPVSARGTSPVVYPDGLTSREVEVLRLVAQGLSNAEIAEQLIISLLTVKAHMRSLYNKLGIGSRSAATRYAIEHHLV